MTENKKDEYIAKIGTANKTQLIVVIYDIMLDYLSDAKTALADKNTSDFSRAVTKVHDGLNNLMDGLNFDYEISGNLLSLYSYINRQLLLIKLKKDSAIIDDIKSIIVSLRDAFNEISKQDTSSAMMESMQHVEVGMTYGRNSLNENIVNSGKSRTFSV